VFVALYLAATVTYWANGLPVFEAVSSKIYCVQYYNAKSIIQNV